jgi:hypothetical protein
VGDLDHTLHDRKLLRIEIEITPPEPQQLASAHTRCRGQVEGRVKPVVTYEFQKSPEVARIPRRKLPCSRSSGAGRVSRKRWVGV